MRIIYRFVEFSQGITSSNPILTHESYTYGLDAFPMLLATVLLNIVHPCIVLKGQESEFPRLTCNEKRVIKKEKKEARKQERMDNKAEKESRKQKKTSRNGGERSQTVPGTAETPSQNDFVTFTVGEYQDFDDTRSPVREV
jgi:hypothetical protein